MNKKGFTLVELLAVIAILAILAIIAMPNILDIFKGAKKDTFASEAISILEAANTASQIGSLDSKKYDINSDGVYTDAELASLIEKEGYKFCVKYNTAGKPVVLLVSNSEFNIKISDDTGIVKTDITSNNVMDGTKTLKADCTDFSG